MTRRPITVVIDVSEDDMSYDESDAQIVGAGITDAVQRYVNAGGELDRFDLFVEPLGLQTMTGLRIRLEGMDRDSDWTPAGAA